MPLKGLKTYESKLYKPWQNILHESEAPPLHHALLQVRHATALLDELKKKDKGAYAQYQLEPVYQLLSSIPVESYAEMKEFFEHTSRKDRARRLDKDTVESCHEKLLEAEALWKTALADKPAPEKNTEAGWHIMPAQAHTLKALKVIEAIINKEASQHGL